MGRLFAALLVVHGLLHLIGPAKAFGWAALPHITTPIGRGAGLVWAAAAVLMLASAAVWLLRPTWFAYVAVAAAVLSQAAIVLAWKDAFAGTAANALVLAGAVYAWGNYGPWSQAAQFAADVAAGRARLVGASAPATITEADLAALPAPVARWLRAAGVPGGPRAQRYAISFRGRLRSGPDAAWMPFTAEQVSFVDAPTRLFFLRATMFGLPVTGYHRLVNGRAEMRIRLLGLIPIVDVDGPAMDRAETVTLFNDMALLAPRSLIGAPVEWTTVSDTEVRARYTNGENTISAVLYFGDDGMLTNFTSDDRPARQPDGRFAAQRFSTPVLRRARFGRTIAAAYGEARYDAPTGPYTYGEFTIERLQCDPP